MKTIGLATLFVLLACGAPALAQTTPATKTQEGALITHLPLNEVFTGEQAVLSFEVRDPQLLGVICVHVLAEPGIPGPREPHMQEAKRTARGYEAELPSRWLAPPGFRYYVSERMPDGSERPVFADASAPHPVRVSRTPEAEDELERLDARGGKRSAWVLSAEAVDYGDRHLAGSKTDLHDRYYRLEAGYAYSFLSRVDAIRLSLVRVRGQAATFGDTPVPSVVATAPGIDYGRAEVTFYGNEYLRLRGALLLGASQHGFEYGGGAGLTIGDTRDLSLELGVEHVTTLGTTGRLRLGFAAHPRVPMGASVEVSSFPVGDDAGVRLLYDVGYRFGRVTQLVLRAGYQGRTSVTGGPSAGLSFDYGF